MKAIRNAWLNFWIWFYSGERGSLRLRLFGWWFWSGLRTRLTGAERGWRKT